MPVTKTKKPRDPNRLTVRFSPEVGAYWRQRAHESGESVSEFVRQTLTHGVISENVQHIEARLNRTLEALKAENERHEEALGKLAERIEAAMAGDTVYKQFMAPQLTLLELILSEQVAKQSPDMLREIRKRAKEITESRLSRR